MASITKPEYYGLFIIPGTKSRNQKLGSAKKTAANLQQPWRNLNHINTVSKK